MNVRSMFPSKFVAAHDLAGQDVNVVVSAIKVEPVGSDEEMRPVLYFQGFVKGMVLNRTNAKRIEQMYGGETDSWVGRPVTLYPSETEYGGETVPCIRVRQAPPMLSQVAAQSVVPPVVVTKPATSGSPQF